MKPGLSFIIKCNWVYRVHGSPRYNIGVQYRSWKTTSQSDYDDWMKNRMVHVAKLQIMKRLGVE